MTQHEMNRRKQAIHTEEIVGEELKKECAAFRQRFLSGPESGLKDGQFSGENMAVPQSKDS